jgi:alpha-D-xyloside xylohydrolase
LRDNATGVCTWQPQTVEVSVEESLESRVYTSAALVVEVSKHTGAVLFRDRQTGRVLLQENARQPHQAEPVVEERIVYDEASARVEDTANVKVTVKDIVRRDTIGTSTRYRVDFCFADDQALYGLGSHMEDYMNLLGKTLWLTQHNLKATIPVISSTNGYGLLFDAGSAMKFETHRAARGYEGTMQIEAARELDYYFIKGETMDDVVKGYRWLTGRVSMMPRYIFGYTQSKERSRVRYSIIAWWPMCSGLNDPE